MRGLVQRVTEASVTDKESGEVVGSIGTGLLVLVGVTGDDDEAGARKLASKVWNLRVFPDTEGAMNVSLAALSETDPDTGVLVVSQFTLYGDTRKGRRPSYVAAAAPGHAEPLIESLVAELEDLGATVATGRFRTDMAVASVNDGPVTLMVET